LNGHSSLRFAQDDSGGVQTDSGFERQTHQSPSTILLMMPFWISLLPP
jgi:hypothetical protein